MIPLNSGSKYTEMNLRNAQSVYWFVLGCILQFVGKDVKTGTNKRKTLRSKEYLKI